MHFDGRHVIKFLVFGASLRQKSLNDRLASLAASVVEAKGGTVDRATGFPISAVLVNIACTA